MPAPTQPSRFWSLLPVLTTYCPSSPGRFSPGHSVPADTFQAPSCASVALQSASSLTCLSNGSPSLALQIPPVLTRRCAPVRSCTVRYAPGLTSARLTCLLLPCLGFPGRVHPGLSCPSSRSHPGHQMWGARRSLCTATPAPEPGRSCAWWPSWRRCPCSQQPPRSPSCRSPAGRTPPSTSGRAPRTHHRRSPALPSP